GTPPFEYVALRATPVPWRPEDSMLVSLAMFITLQGNQPERESAVGLLRDTLPPGLATFLDPHGSPWDAPAQGGPQPPPPMPGPDVFDLRQKPAPTPKTAALDEDQDPPSAGSNNWAVAGAHTASGVPLLANDMHLAIGVPNTWYRVTRAWPE